MTAIIIDAVVGIIILVSTLIATMRGFVREMLTIVGLLGSMAVTWLWGGILQSFYAGHLVNWAESKLEEPATEAITHLQVFGLGLPIDIIAIVLSYGSVFAGIFIVFSLLNLYLSSLVQESNLSTLDRSLGALFGLARGVILVVLLYMPVTLFIGDDGERPEWLVQAKSVPLLEYTVDFVRTNFLPEVEDIEDAVKSVAKNAEEHDVVKDAKKVVQGVVERNIVKGASGRGSNNADGYEGSERTALDELIKKELGK